MTRLLHTHTCIVNHVITNNAYLTTQPSSGTTTYKNTLYASTQHRQAQKTHVAETSVAHIHEHPGTCTPRSMDGHGRDNTHQNTLRCASAPSQYTMDMSRARIGMICAHSTRTIPYRNHMQSTVKGSQTHLSPARPPRFQSMPHAQPHPSQPLCAVDAAWQWVHTACDTAKLPMCKTFPHMARQPVDQSAHSRLPCMHAIFTLIVIAFTARCSLFLCVIIDGNGSIHTNRRPQPHRRGQNKNQDRPRVDAYLSLI